MKAVWTYLSDKLVIPVAELNKDNIRLKMNEKGMEKEVTDNFTNILNTCEYASYAPDSGRQEMGNLYGETVDAISRMEEHFKKK